MWKSYQSGPDGVDDLLHTIVYQTVQLTVPNSMSIHDDACREGIVELVVFPERCVISWPLCCSTHLEYHLDIPWLRLATRALMQLLPAVKPWSMPRVHPPYNGSSGCPRLSNVPEVVWGLPHLIPGNLSLLSPTTSFILAFYSAFFLKMLPTWRLCLLFCNWVLNTPVLCWITITTTIRTHK